MNPIIVERMVRLIKILKRVIMVLLILLYLAATIAKSNFWGNILSPIVMLEFSYVIYIAFYRNVKKGYSRLSGLLLSLSVLSWAITDILWAVLDMIYHIDPEEVDIITYGYASVNLLLALSLTIYGFSVFRKWNIVQVILDSVVMSFFVIDLIWIVFLDEDVKRIMKLRSDWVSTASIVLDILIIIWVTIWFLSIRNGMVPRFLKLTVAGVLLYGIIDLVYFYQYFFCTYDPNTILDAIYISPFLLIAIAALLRIDNKAVDTEPIVYNIGRKGRGNFLLAAPLILIIFKGFEVTDLLQFVSIILIYNMVSTYIQNNIYKEGLLRKEKELNNVLEQKVKARTEELVDKNKVLENLINQDFVTGLYNRRFLITYLEESIASLQGEETIVLLYIDINRFKMITTMFGHDFGEKVLHEMAEKLKPIEKQVDRSILASYGEDIFIFAAKGQYDYAQGYKLAQEAIRLCSNIYRIDDYHIKITVNIGISIFPYDSDTKEKLIKHADIAMSQARVQGFNMVQEFDLKLSEVIFRRNTIEIMLKKVIFKQEFMVYYQPQLQTDSKKIIGFEALLRWKTATGEFIPPSEFIPIAEETGYIIPIGDWVIKVVMMQLADWNLRFDDKIMIGINISLKQLNTIQFLDKLKNEMDRLSLKPEWIDLEITESFQLLENPEIMRKLEEIRNMGITISIDDFGTGFSSLSYFKGLPADRIKLAKELVDYIHIDDFDYQLVKSIIQLSKAKGIRVIAEGVETIEQWECLKELQCDEVQGFLFGKPMPYNEIETIYGTLMKSNI